jgi:hypothetical protein
MNTSEINDITSHHRVKTETMLWSGFKRVNQQSAVNQHCYYCNGSLECGQEECIWHQACA